MTAGLRPGFTQPPCLQPTIWAAPAPLGASVSPMPAKVLGLLGAATVFAACGGAASSGASDADASSGTDGPSASDSPLDGGIESGVVPDAGLTCTLGAILNGGSGDSVCTINVDLECSDGMVHHAACIWPSPADASPPGGVCYCDVMDLQVPMVLSATVGFAGSSCPTAPQAWKICGWPQPPRWTFACGTSPGCAAGADLCSVSATGCGAPSQKSIYWCTPAPEQCGPDASPSGCGCLSPLGAGCSCSDDGIGNLTLTCCSGDGGSDAATPDGDIADGGTG